MAISKRTKSKLLIALIPATLYVVLPYTLRYVLWLKLFRPMLIIYIDLHIGRDSHVAEVIALGVVFTIVWLISLGLLSLFYLVVKGSSK